MHQLKQIHAHTLRNGIDFTKFLITKLLEIPNIPYAHKMFDLIPQPNVFLYNKLIQAFSSHGPVHNCFTLYTQMCLSGCSPNQHSFTSLFAASATLHSPRQGQTLHAHLVKLGYEFDLYASTALVDMYAKLGMLPSARQVFDKTKTRDVPTWNSLIAGKYELVHALFKNSRSDIEGALKVLDEMPAMGMLPNVVTYTTILGAYVSKGDMVSAKKIFDQILDRGWTPDATTYTILMDGFCKQGRLVDAVRVMDDNKVDPNDVTYGVMA
ncbi:hypothetical protein L1987_59065 [Smallanthus sonchifolius]|uniref:Uncharacterized protein n=1 Tax=Smallanthus sonchifolius TaxID=185202 RepID=A0ACB9D4S2_9ASTR|nr:hypothetical protein L1987_59065 [Smallanthus sonchifolius]